MAQQFHRNWQEQGAATQFVAQERHQFFKGKILLSLMRNTRFDAAGWLAARPGSSRGYRVPPDLPIEECAERQRHRPPKPCHHAFEVGLYARADKGPGVRSRSANRSARPPREAPARLVFGYGGRSDG